MISPDEYQSKFKMYQDKIGGALSAIIFITILIVVNVELVDQYHSCVNNLSNTKIIGRVINILPGDFIVSVVDQNRTCSVIKDRDLIINSTYTMYISSNNICSFNESPNKCDDNLTTFNITFVLLGPFACTCMGMTFATILLQLFYHRI